MKILLKIRLAINLLLHPVARIRSKDFSYLSLAYNEIIYYKGFIKASNYEKEMKSYKTGNLQADTYYSLMIKESYLK